MSMFAIRLFVQSKRTEAERESKQVLETLGLSDD